ncbi:uncharacterized protein LOC142358597 [Convolutriloba macropyga]|uniref:uncharacterized protein LOC142358597 n=1 Tax=Convolutriloba macropyga TaxID=536237 RepID=UPI003F51C5FF
MSSLAGKKVLMVVTNNSKLGETGKKTGFYLPEVAHPYHEFTQAGLEVVFASPLGGHSPVDPGSVDGYKEDKQCTDFINNEDIKKLLDTTLAPESVDAKDYVAVFFAGGHAPMWDVSFSQPLGDIASQVYGSQNGVVGAVCHGTCGLLTVKVAPGSEESILKGRKVTSFTNAEEEDLFEEEAWNIMNFKLETKLGEMGAEFHGADNWSCNVITDRGVVTGQNPQSAGKCAEKIIEELKAKL